MNAFGPNVPLQHYPRDITKVQKRPAEYGTIFKAKRFNSPREKSPGVGDYDLTKYKSFAKVSERGFEIPESVKLLSKFAKKN